MRKKQEGNWDYLASNDLRIKSKFLSLNLWISRDWVGRGEQEPEKEV